MTDAAPAARPDWRAVLEARIRTLQAQQAQAVAQANAIAGAIELAQALLTELAPPPDEAP